MALCVSTDRRYVESLRLFMFHGADVLVVFGHRKQLVRVRKISCFGLKSLCFVVTNTAGKRP